MGSLLTQFPSILCSYTQHSTTPHLLHPLLLGQLLLFCQKCILATEYNTQKKETTLGMQAWHWGETLPLIVSAEFVLVLGAGPQTATASCKTLQFGLLSPCQRTSQPTCLYITNVILAFP